jgi:peptide deformylase
MIRILMDDDPLLREISKPVAEFATDALYALLADMEEALRQYRGVGLAAVQIGVLKRVMMIRGTGGYWAMVNPDVTRTLNRNAVANEGCLSVPRYKWGPVSRPAKCDATWFTATGDQQSATLTGELARIFQHELDHLNGVLMTDKRAA